MQENILPDYAELAQPLGAYRLVEPRTAEALFRVAVAVQGDVQRYARRNNLSVAFQPNELFAMSYMHSSFMRRYWNEMSGRGFDWRSVIFDLECAGWPAEGLSVPLAQDGNYGWSARMSHKFGVSLAREGDEAVALTGQRQALRSILTAAGASVLRVLQPSHVTLGRVRGFTKLESDDTQAFRNMIGEAVEQEGVKKIHFARLFLGTSYKDQVYPQPVA